MFPIYHFFEFAIALIHSLVEKSPHQPAYSETDCKLMSQIANEFENDKKLYTTSKCSRPYVIDSNVSKLSKISYR